MSEPTKDAEISRLNTPCPTCKGRGWHYRPDVDELVPVNCWRCLGAGAARDQRPESESNAEIARSALGVTEQELANENNRLRQWLIAVTGRVAEKDAEIERLRDGESILWEQLGERDIEYASLRQQLEQARAALAEVLSHSGTDTLGDYVCWIGESTFEKCRAAIDKSREEPKL